ncbi:hypothetical protein TASIC1_0010023600 [Trichoderma asperellum]|uniref:Uncharacterized protein n=1 Tax=Trichoderma asperellum TaxID=101201 RepID=A0A6V8R2L7_TRIAP|nr:hypothetical protein TASIC1_0010023600 [Trichoderma asperellum]
MPPEDIASAARIRKVRSFIDFAANLQSKLCDPLEVTDIEVLIADTGHYIQQIHHATQPGSSGPLPSNLAKDAERHGGNLWNLCNTKLIAKARFFAFNMLELGRSAGRTKKDDTSEAVDLMNLALELAKYCMAVSDLDSARLALQKAAELMERLKTTPVESLDSIRANERMKLDAEYLAMRTAMLESLGKKIGLTLQSTCLEKLTFFDRRLMLALQRS